MDCCASTLPSSRFTTRLRLACCESFALIASMPVTTSAALSPSP